VISTFESGPPTEGVPSVMYQITHLIEEHFAWEATAQPTARTRIREDLDLDSLHVVELQVAIEDHFQVTFDPTDEEFLDAFATIGSLEAYVCYLLEKDT
jgi:acyl carrier protein